VFGSDLSQSWFGNSSPLTGHELSSRRKKVRSTQTLLHHLYYLLMLSYPARRSTPPSTNFNFTIRYFISCYPRPHLLEPAKSLLRRNHTFSHLKSMATTSMTSISSNKHEQMVPPSETTLSKRFGSSGVLFLSELVSQTTPSPFARFVPRLDTASSSRKTPCTKLKYLLDSRRKLRS
jgi:hypothetical protein